MQWILAASSPDGMRCLRHSLSLCMKMLDVAKLRDGQPWYRWFHERIFRWLGSPESELTATSGLYLEVGLNVAYGWWRAVMGRPSSLSLRPWRHLVPASEFTGRLPCLVEGNITVQVRAHGERLQPGKSARLEPLRHRPLRAIKACSMWTRRSGLQQRVDLLQGTVPWARLLACLESTVDLAPAWPILNLRVDQLNICFDPEHLLSQVRQRTRRAVVAASRDGREARRLPQKRARRDSWHNLLMSLRSMHPIQTALNVDLLLLVSILVSYLP